jgi:class 3 adenylate cyclase/tetratricopeptide (TPR) repeat protein
MRCPRCDFENPDGVRFCGGCGSPLNNPCPNCSSHNPPHFRYCGQCGFELSGLKDEEDREATPSTEGERKRVTALFCDLSGYTSMTERLDPEEVREIMSRIFGDVAQVIARYEGFIEKFIGDAVVALFGVPKAHEDDPVRAIWAAIEIHRNIEEMGSQIENRIGMRLYMHSGVNSGLVVMGKVDPQSGTHGVTGDAINVASRLSSLAAAGEILVGPETYREAEGHFSFQHIGPVSVKGRAEPVEVYKVVGRRVRPTTVRRLSGLRAELIGRRVELSLLEEGVERLRGSQGSVFCICGDAGTGKSRLIEEFRAAKAEEGIRWLEGHAYAYTQNIPYFLFTDMLGRTWDIDETDPHEKVREKLEEGLGRLMVSIHEVIPYIGGLFSLGYPEVHEVSPEGWKARLFEAIRAVSAAFSASSPTAVIFEDIHWADPSSQELLRFVVTEAGCPVMFVLTYRPPFGLLSTHQAHALGEAYREIRLGDLSPSEARQMALSLLGTDSIPAELQRFIQEKVEGNPFYLEEIINSLIEAGILVREAEGWSLGRPITEADIPSTVQGVISARLDRLEDKIKRVLQEASVIGRAFRYDILKEITEIRREMDNCLGTLERLDLIRTRTLQPELEYVFKHALTQEAVYNGLLKRERQEIHERIALAIEELFRDRLPEFYESLAFHFRHGRSWNKAVEYLMRSGEKSIRRYAVEESHNYFREAYEILSGVEGLDRRGQELLVDLLMGWAYVFYYRGDFAGLTGLLERHQRLAESLEDEARLGMFYGWYGMSLWCRERFEDSYAFLLKALELGERKCDQKVIGIACAWLSYSCIELGLLDEAIRFGERAQEICKSLPGDHYMYFKSLAGIGQAHWVRGERKKALAAGKALLDYGNRNSNIRSLVMGHLVIGLSHFMNGDFPAAIESLQSAVRVSADPFFAQIPALILGLSHMSMGQFQEAERVFKEIDAFSSRFGTEIVGIPAKVMLGVTDVAKGNLSRGTRTLKEGQRRWKSNNCRYRYALGSYIIGSLYRHMAEGGGSLGIMKLARNIGFLLKDYPQAARESELYLMEAIHACDEIGAMGVKGNACLELGLLKRAKGKKDEAKRWLSQAVELFERCEVDNYLQQARNALATL